MFADPQSVTVDAVPISLPRVRVGDRTASYVNDDETLSLSIAHTTTGRGRVRRMVRIDNSKVAQDLFDANRSREVDSAVYLVIDEPQDSSFGNDELLLNVKALKDWLSDANITKVLAGES